MAGENTIGQSNKITKSSLLEGLSRLKGLKGLQNNLSLKENTKEENWPKVDYASLCMLAYERPHFLNDTLYSLKNRPAYPYELLIHDDGSTDWAVRERLIQELYASKSASTVIFNSPGHNQGQGTSLNRMFSISSGDPIIKLDADLEYRAGWLSETIRLMKMNPEIGLLGLTHYYADPVDTKKTVINRYDEWSSHTHILGSCFAVRRKCWEELGPFSEHSTAFAEDWEFQQAVTESKNWVCALPKESLVENPAMGYETSTVNRTVGGELPPIKMQPYIVGKEDE
jgi:cellulose synthase/poly-beta-1,6-N-acetylglucosamine synthase-like glycosyltransferase